MIPVTLVVEDALSEQVMRRLLASRYSIGTVYGLRGIGYIQQHIGGFNHAARGGPWAVLADLDREPCPPGMIARWLPHGRHANLILRIALREVEAWLLADRNGFARFARIRAEVAPAAPEELQNPKETLLHLVRESRNSALKADVLPQGNVGVGPGYNARLGVFARDHWNLAAARQAAPSLHRAMTALARFNWP